MPSAHEILERLQEEMNAVMTDSGDRAAQPANTRKAYSRPQALWKVRPLSRSVTPYLLSYSHLS
jgi:hypothetical protein